MLLGLLLSNSACMMPVSSQPVGNAAAAAPQIFDPREDEDFGDATPALTGLVAGSDPKPRGLQHFCVVGYRGPDGEHAWVHWREARRLIFWLGRGDGTAPAETLLRSTRKLSLDEDVVATESEIAGSTYLVSRAWVDGRLADCQAHGAQYTISSPNP